MKLNKILTSYDECFLIHKIVRIEVHSRFSFAGIIFPLPKLQPIGLRMKYSPWMTRNKCLSIILLRNYKKLLNKLRKVYLSKL